MASVKVRPVAVPPPEQPYSTDAQVPGPLAVDEATREASWQGHRLDLSPTEFAVLAHLLRRAGQTVTYEALLQNVGDSPLDRGGSVSQVRTLSSACGKSWPRSVAPPANSSAYGALDTGWTFPLLRRTVSVLPSACSQSLLDPERDRAPCGSGSRVGLSQAEPWRPRGSRVVSAASGASRPAVGSAARAKRRTSISLCRRAAS